MNEPRPDSALKSISREEKAAYGPVKNELYGEP